MTTFKTLLLSALLISMVSCHNESFDLFPDNIQKIETDSELFNSLKSISESKNEDNKPVCITFVYPFNVYLFDENSEIVDSRIVYDNIDFVGLLEDSEGTNSAIGLSYPITTILEDGSSFSIQDNAELKKTIEACIESEIIIYCNRILEENCIWKITSSTNNQNYNDALLDFYDDGTGIFYDNGNAYRTSWISFFLEGKLHINIHLEGNSKTAKDWNFDWKAMIIDDETVEVSNETDKYIIKRQCNIKNSCDYVEFKECELKNFEDTANFVFDDYKDCILSFQENIDPSLLTLSFYQTYEHAEQETNILDSSVYQNTTNPQLVFVNIKNTDTNESKIIRIVLFAEACDNNNES
ncbi:hypothetical protein [Aquimarina macrocephali]|uniref:hypothetical protein n=1 Tax=Aquimarina macrocephali TaxID=666563 RepID=UPI0004650D7E|nr:hypothetical protein [Aquimarina macrocephali]